MDIICPGCGETDDLSGEKQGDDIIISCGSCSTSWPRDLTPRCGTCGSTDVREARQAIVEKSRGTQLSIQSFRPVWLCPDCDPEKMARFLVSNRPLPPDELPTESEP